MLIFSKHKLYTLGYFLWPLLFTISLSAQLPDDFYSTKIQDGYNLPLGITFDQSGQGYLWEQAGKVHIITKEGEQLAEPLIDLTEEITSWKDHGLNSLCLDKDFLINGYFYLYYTVDLHHYWHYGTPEYHPDSTVTYKPTFGRITRYQADVATDFTTIVPDSRKILLGEHIDTGVPILLDFHGLGTILQGTDRSLLFSSGETTGGLMIGIGNEPGDEFVPQAIEWGIITADEDLGAYKSQYLANLNGKVMRIDSETGDGLSSNPFFQDGDPRSPQSMVWALGFRNPYRMVLRPNTGSHSPEDGNPGTLLIGDVGNGSWEEVSICDKGGQNFGWPILEGIDLAWKFWIQDVPMNPLAPNPIPNCENEYFTFRDLLARPRADGPYVPANPCDPSQPIPAEAYPFYATPPMLVWNNANWNEPTRAATHGWTENGSSKALFMETPEATIDGEAFEGYSSLAGIFYEGDQFPEAYQGKYFHVDYSGWIKVFDIDEFNELHGVEPFHDYSKDIIHLAQNPYDGCLYYTNVEGELFKISYGGNPAPIAVIDADRFYGPGPLEVTFSASNSYDPNNTMLDFQWDFGDGATSTAENPTHVFVGGANEIKSYTVKLTVSDSLGASNSTTRIVSLNNTPPAVSISSFKDGDLYPLNATSLLRLAADVQDAEHSNEELQYTWRTFFHHNTHFHPDPPLYDPESFLLVSPLGCEEEIYYYRIELTVTDPEGLATTVSQQIFPDCNDPFIEWLELSGDPDGKVIQLNWGSQFTEEVVAMEIHRAKDFLNFEHIATLPAVDNSSAAQQYSYEDQSPMLGSNIYRIKALKADGAFSYSNLFTTSFPKPLDWKVFPNPTNYELNLYIKNTQASVVEFELFNVAGQQLRKAGFDTDMGVVWQREILVDQLPPGVYSYRLKNGEAIYTGQVVIY